MKTDSKIQNDVMEELKWDPSVTHEHVGVAVKDGIVTLSGYVPTYVEKSAAEKAVQRVAGVRAIAEKIEVKYPGSYRRDDEDIAGTILAQFKWTVQVPDDQIKVQVSKGWVTLGGDVQWEFQKTAAVNAVKGLIGVTGVSNLIEIKPKVQISNIKTKIEEALKRAAEREADRINIEVEGSKVILNGKVRSFAELIDARGAAWSAPGVSHVEDHLRIGT